MDAATRAAIEAGGEEIVTIGKTETVLSPGVTPKKSSRNRLSIVELAYFNANGEQPDLFETRFVQWLDTEELPYKRKPTISSQWTPLLTGWLSDSIGFVLIENIEGRFLQQQPTDEERKAIASRIVEIGFATGPDQAPVPVLDLLPGTSQRIYPHKGVHIFLRCCSDQAKVRIVVMPV